MRLLSGVFLLCCLVLFQGEPCNYPYAVPGKALSGSPAGKKVEESDLAKAKVKCIKLGPLCSGITLTGQGKYGLHSSGELADVMGATSWPKICDGLVYQAINHTEPRSHGKMVSPGPLDGIVNTRKLFPNQPPPVVADTRESRAFPEPDKKKMKNFWKAMVRYLLGMEPATPVSAEDLEDCVGCRFIWSQVENEIGYSRLESQVYESFTKFCRQAETTYIFFATCQDMYERLDDMVVGYMKGWSVDKMCDYSDQCRKVLLTMGTKTKKKKKRRG